MPFTRAYVSRNVENRVVLGILWVRKGTPRDMGDDVGQKLLGTASSHDGPSIDVRVAFLDDGLTTPTRRCRNDRLLTESRPGPTRHDLKVWKPFQCIHALHQYHPSTRRRLTRRERVTYPIAPGDFGPTYARSRPARVRDDIDARTSSGCLSGHGHHVRGQ